MQAVEAMCFGVDAACEYRPELATLELIGEVRRLLAMGQRIEHLVCRYLAELADRMRQGLARPNVRLCKSLPRVCFTSSGDAEGGRSMRSSRAAGCRRAPSLLL